MMPAKEFGMPLGLATLVLGISMIMLFSGVSPAVAPGKTIPQAPTVAGAISHSQFYPAVHVEVPSTSIFAKDSSY